jgi:hypothetical protein
MTQQQTVNATVALERMWIYARQLNATEKDTLSHTLMCGGEVTYTACDVFGQPIGQTTLKPQDFPVTLVTETNR